MPDAAISAAHAPLDPVRLVSLTLERLGPATFRTAAIGKPVEVVVPDFDTAAVFRAALSQSRRSTDRLLTIVVAPDAV